MNHLKLPVGDFDAGFPIEIIREGKVRVLVPKLEAFAKTASDYAPSKAPVFYNPVMELNRDLSVLAVQAFQRIADRDLSICEPLSSSGIRGVRYAVEVQGVRAVAINDISKRAANLASYNIRLNELQERITISNEDANCLLGCHGAPDKRFDVVDLDPFGSPVPYLDSSIRALRDTGLLAVTATDLAPLCGVHPKACIRKYGGKPLRTEYCHELAVRLLIGCIDSVAAKHNIGIRPVFSHSTDHYVRVYAQICFGAKKADESIKKLGYIVHCFNCLHRNTILSLFRPKIEKCPECGSALDYAGPLWLDKIVDTQFCELMINENSRRVLRNNVRVAQVLSQIKDEAEAPPTYYVIDKLSSKLSLPAPAVNTMIEKLKSAGYQVVPTHFNSRGLKTEIFSLEIQRILGLSISERSKKTSSKI